MKHIVVAATLFVSFVMPLKAVSFDAEAFGASLHGWRKDRTAVYTINNRTYRTHVPTTTRTRDGGLFISTRIERGGRSGPVCFLELTFGPGGTLMAGQVRVNVGRKLLDSGLVTRSEPQVAGEEGAELPPPASETLVLQLFSRLDAELAKLSAKDKQGRRDIFGRLARSTSGGADIPAAVRHNMNLLMANVH